MLFHNPCWLKHTHLYLCIHPPTAGPIDKDFWSAQSQNTRMLLLGNKVLKSKCSVHSLNRTDGASIKPKLCGIHTHTHVHPRAPTGMPTAHTHTGTHKKDLQTEPKCLSPPSDTDSSSSCTNRLTDWLVGPLLN